MTISFLSRNFLAVVTPSLATRPAGILAAIGEKKGISTAYSSEWNSVRL
jgi:hypothetical protein